MSYALIFLACINVIMLAYDAYTVYTYGLPKNVEARAILATAELLLLILLAARLLLYVEAL